MSRDTEAAYPKKEKPETRPFSIRFTEEERAALLERAGRIPLGTFIRDIIFAEGCGYTRRRSPVPVKDHEALGRVLAALGQSRIANNLNQLAKAANIGALPVTVETEAEISEACGAVVAMRRDLITALGLLEGASP